ncbi:DUF1327 domain-containing protein [Salmonella enterica]|nr:DUF1327 domain-containing protein [Salmonella enterica]
MNLDLKSEEHKMNKYILKVKSLYLVNETVSVGLGVYSSQMPSLLLFSMEIEMERKGDASLSAYEMEAIEKAASLICDIADKLEAAA